MKKQNIFSLIAISVTALLLGALLIDNPAVARQVAGGRNGVIGQFTVGPYSQARTRLARDGKSDDKYWVTGPNGGVVMAKTALYELSAERMEFTVGKVQAPGKSGTRLRRKAVLGTANGSVKIVVRQPEQNRKTVITGEQAVYTAKRDDKDQGRLILTGTPTRKVKTVTEDPGFAPLITEDESVELSFTPEGDLQIVQKNGVVSGVPIEPTPKPKKP